MNDDKIHDVSSKGSLGEPHAKMHLIRIICQSRQQDPRTHPNQAWHTNKCMAMIHTRTYQQSLDQGVYTAFTIIALSEHFPTTPEQGWARRIASFHAWNCSRARWENSRKREEGGFGQAWCAPTIESQALLLMATRLRWLPEFHPTPAKKEGLGLLTRRYINGFSAFQLLLSIRNRTTFN
jgi:hypothetical protein